MNTITQVYACSGCGETYEQIEGAAFCCIMALWRCDNCGERYLLSDNAAKCCANVAREKESDAKQ